MHLARLLFIRDAYWIKDWFMIVTVFLFSVQLGYIMFGIFRLLKEIIKRVDPIEGFGAFFLWILFGGLLLNSFKIMLLEHDTASFIVFVFFLIIFLIASPLLFNPFTKAYNKFLDDNKKK
jgi:hypothetical protein